MIDLVAFLGNYGAEYEKTRHNAAWLFCNFLGLEQGFNFQNKFSSNYASPTFAQYADFAKLETTASDLKDRGNSKLYFQKPMTYMNNSGKAVAPLACFFKVTAQNILIVHDELELPFGTISLKFSGGLGGHNGLRSLKQELGTADFWRLRFGISKPQNQDIAGYVLSPFSKKEQAHLPFIFAQAKDILNEMIFEKNLQKLLEKYSKLKVPLP